MSHTTAVLRIKAARKEHICDWCYQMIEKGEPYSRYTEFDGDCITARMHNECFDAMTTSDIPYGEPIIAGQNPRGCNCGHSIWCDKCNPDRKAA